MNDPGLEEPIKESAKDVEHAKDDNVANEDPDGVDDDDEAYLEPSRWWIASTAIPLIAGTFGPMASAFNICALAGKWRVIAYAGQSADDGDHIPDPSWLIGVNALSLALALIANLALLFNMARRMPFTIAQPVTIIGWFLSSFLLIGLVVAAALSPSFQLHTPAKHSLTQAFYYAIMAAAMYFIIASLMCVTVYGAAMGHYPRAFKLTMSQRTLMIQTISYLAYLLAGGAVFAHIEDWLFLDGVYWANTTLLTIGTGDYSPTTHLGQGLLFPYAIGGILFLGLVIGSIRSLVLERGKKKMGVRMVEKKREKIVKQMDGEDGSVRVSPFTKSRDLAQGEKQPEFDRRRKEFEVMRMIQNHARVKRKWISLATSLLAWFFLWFVGAAVFWVGERDIQQMTYFEAMYFAYVSLLTIGYGDYSPAADSSKAFFVLWSLLAVPTLTILISNMGDTVVKLVSDSTLWLSEMTVLPGEKPKLERIKEVARKTRIYNLTDVDERATAEEEEEKEKKEEAQQQQDRDPEAGVGQAKAADALSKGIEATELAEAERARQRGDRVDANKHLHHYLLVKEMRRLMKDSGANPPKRYSYREWTWLLWLLGEDEGSSDLHRKPPLDPQDVRGQPALGATDGDGAPWSWVGTRSPLMGDQDEADWLLERMSQKLEGLLRREHRDGPPPPPAAASSGSEGGRTLDGQQQ